MEKELLRVPFIIGDKIDLVILEPERHLESSRLFLSDPTVIEFLGMRNFPLTLAKEKRWFEDESDNKVVLAIETKDGRHIGNIGLHNIDWMNRRAVLGIFIIKEFWRRGIASEAGAMIVKYAFGLGLEKVIADVLEPNKGSAGVLEKHGFRLAGRFRKHVFRNGNWHDQLTYELLREDIKG